MKRPALFFLFLLLILKVVGQDYNYVHYDTRDGLAGSTVYRICQDKKGYIWFATENGVSRFDGKRFRNFTTEDGLTDNEVLCIGSDSKGRVWMMPFNKTICYYYDGKIHSGKNDSSLRNAVIKSYVSFFCEAKTGELYLICTDGVYLFTNSEIVKPLVDFEKLASEYGLNANDFDVSYSKKWPNYLVLSNRNYLFTEQNGKFSLWKKINYDATTYKGYVRWHLENSELKPFAIPKSLTSITSINDSIAIYNTLNGSWLANGQGFFNRPLLEGKRVSNSLMDNEGNLWFSTLGEGVYKLISRSIKTFAPSEEFFTVEKAKGKVFGGTASGILYSIFNEHLVEEKFPPKFLGTVNLGTGNPGRLYSMRVDSGGAVYIGFDSYLAKFKDGNKIYSAIRPIKSIDLVDNEHIVICTNFYTLKLRSSDLKVVDTIWRERGTNVIYDDGNYYIGTLKGLVIVDRNKQAIKVGEDDSLLSKRIVDICKISNGYMGIATNDNGVLILKNGKVDTVINYKNGLSSNICKSLFFKDKFLWVGTNKGLNKIDIDTKKVVMSYSTSDGLSSDVINAIYVDNDTVWVSSPSGLTYFNEKDIQNNSICNLDLNSIHVSDKEINRENINLSYKDNNISFDFTAISFKAAGDVTYHYRLVGLSDELEETKVNSVSYPSLPPGNYEFQLYATNKFKKESNVIKIPFSIAAPFWKTIWFWVSICTVVILAIWYLFRRRYRILHERLVEKNIVTKRIAELEQTALRAQMNPHFIFNCLSSIQHFILKGDFELANRYITRLATLIRQTLDNSGKTSISIADEINYLTNYLELEQMRFVSKFQYDISLDKQINASHTYIPPMMLQPFVENAIRHGIRHKTDGEGLIQIKIERHDRFMEFIVEDNGVGREISGSYKTKQHIEYQSKGISLTRERLEMLAADSEQKISTSITDLQDDNGNIAGTRVMISFPLEIIDKLN